MPGNMVKSRSRNRKKSKANLPKLLIWLLCCSNYVFVAAWTSFCVELVYYVPVIKFIVLSQWECNRK